MKADETDLFLKNLQGEVNRRIEAANKKHRKSLLGIGLIEGQSNLTGTSQAFTDLQQLVERKIDGDDFKLVLE